MTTIIDPGSGAVPDAGEPQIEDWAAGGFEVVKTPRPVTHAEGVGSP